jgi:hypothetical protein|tara:strand:- start:557 stop:1105 length:549 start_codon:yes stop_codon:yes gene_type:complete
MAMNKKLIPFILFIAILSFQSCTGPVGPRGADGLDGLNGLSGIGTTFDVTANFTNANQYRTFLPFSDTGLEVLESDAVLVYIKWETVNNVEVWRLMPQTTILDEGVLIYNFDRTIDEVSFFMEGSFALSKLDNSYTLNQEFRVVVIPSDFQGRMPGVDYTDYEAVQKMLDIDESKIKTYKAE